MADMPPRLAAADKGLLLRHAAQIVVVPHHAHDCVVGFRAGIDEEDLLEALGQEA
jgi:hypothetical protein